MMTVAHVYNGENFRLRVAKGDLANLFDEMMCVCPVYLALRTLI